MEKHTIASYGIVAEKSKKCNQKLALIKREC